MKWFIDVRAIKKYKNVSKLIKITYGHFNIKKYLVKHKAFTLFHREGHLPQTCTG